MLFMAIPEAALSLKVMGGGTEGNQGLIPVTRVVFLKTELKQARVKRRRGGSEDRHPW